MTALPKGLHMAILCMLVAGGCRGYQYGHLVKDTQADMVGSHAAGAEVYNPLIGEAMAKLLGACEVDRASASFGADGLPITQRICFVGVENQSAEELGDFKEQIYELIDGQITRAPGFEAMSRRVVEAALHETRLRPEALLVPVNMQQFTSVLQRDGQPIDYLLYAKLTSGTTQRNSSSQRDYLLTLEMIDTRTGRPIKEQATIRKGYHKSPLGKLTKYNPFHAGH